MMEDNNESLLAEVDLHVWRVPPPAPIDRASLLGRALAPSIAPPRASRLGWILAAIVVVNAAIATLIVIITRPDPVPALMLPAGGGGVDARVHELLQQLEQREREFKQKLAEIQELHRLITELGRKIEESEKALRDLTPRRVPERPTPPRRVIETGPPDPPRKEVTPPSTQALDRVAISNAMSAVKSQIAACGQRSTTSGTVKVRVRVAPDGSVTSVMVDIPDDPVLVRCVTVVIQTARFPRTLQGGAFSYPFMF
jgi:hypothetical protein